MSFKITRKTVRFILNLVILKNFVFLSYSDANFFLFQVNCYYLSQTKLGNK
jgi:hypothetical protein